MKNGWTSFQETDRKYDAKDKIKTVCAKKGIQSSSETNFGRPVGSESSFLKSAWDDL